MSGRVASADRTRSPRWRAGTRRHRRLVDRRRARTPWWTEARWVV